MNRQPTREDIQRAIQRWHQMKQQYGDQVQLNPEFVKLTKFLNTLKMQQQRFQQQYQQQQQQQQAAAAAATTTTTTAATTKSKPFTTIAIATKCTGPNSTTTSNSSTVF